MLRPLADLPRPKTTQAAHAAPKRCATKVRLRRTPEARDLANLLPLTARERSFPLYQSDGKVCPIADPRPDQSEGPRRVDC